MEDKEIDRIRIEINKKNRRLIELVDNKLPLNEEGKIKMNFGDYLLKNNRLELIIWVPISGNITTLRRDDNGEGVYQIYCHL